MKPANPSTPAKFPVAFGRYVLFGILGEGGMARVYRAELRGPSKFRKPVALKVVRPGVTTEDHSLRDSLLREARIGGLLKHPNIVDIYDFGEEGGQLWIAMELIEGLDLATWLEKFGPPPPSVVLEIGIAICSGLAEAHDLSEDGRPANLIHRDLKPSNVLVSRNGEVKVMDFGIAKVSGIMDGNTRTGWVRGTPQYLSPEQALGNPLDPRSDLFAVGLLLYELATGEPFFNQDTVAAVVSALLEVEKRIKVPSRLDTLEEYIPGLPDVLRCCLRRDPDQRYANARELRHALETLQANLGLGRRSLREYLASRVEQIWPPVPPSGPMPTLARPKDRSSWGCRFLALSLVAVGMAVVALAVGGLWWTKPWAENVRFWPPSERARPTESLRPADALPRVRTQVLVRGEDDVREPSLSPDGSQVVFVRRTKERTELVLREVDGTGERVLSVEPDIRHAQPAFSPDGKQIAFSRRSGLYVTAVEGGEARRITDTGVHPDWSPDGSRLAFTTEPILSAEYKSTRSALWVVDVESRRTRKVFDGDANMADWAPDGKRIAFWSADQDGHRNVFTVAAEGGEPVAVTTGEAVDWNPRWSPDGRYLYFFSDRAGSSALWRVAMDPETGSTLGAPEPVTTGGTASPGFLSRDRSGRRWAYHTWDSEQNLYLLSLPPLGGGSQGDPIEVTHGVRRLQSASLSPDGMRFAFTEQTSQEDVYVMNADGTGQERLTNDLYEDREVAWSPDGSRIAFHSNRDGAYQVWTIRPDGSDLRRVTSGATAFYPIWAPEGHRIAVCDCADGTASIVHLDAEGKQARREQLLLPQLENGIYAPTAWSPDGRRILLTWHSDEGDTVLVYDVETGEHAPLRVPRCTSALWLDNDTLLARRTEPHGSLTRGGFMSAFVQMDWPGGAPVTRYEMPPDRELWWWLATPDARSLILILNTDRTALWVLDLE